MLWWPHLPYLLQLPKEKIALYSYIINYAQATIKSNTWLITNSQILSAMTQAEKYGSNILWKTFIIIVLNYCGMLDEKFFYLFISLG